MPDREKPAVATPTAPAPAIGVGAPSPVGAPVIPPRRSPGHRGADVKDTVAEMAAKAHEISLEAGSKMAAAMKDVVGAAAGLTGLVVESARDLLQYMVRRGQMTQDEADKLMREVEASHAKRKPFPPPAPTAARRRPRSKLPIITRPLMRQLRSSTPRSMPRTTPRTTPRTLRSLRRSTQQLKSQPQKRRR